MAEKPFLFADFVEEFKVTFTVLDELVNGHYDPTGKWVDGNNAVDEGIYFEGDYTLGSVEETTATGDGLATDNGASSHQMEGIILPLSTDELRHEQNGRYTAKDRKIYVTTPLKMGQRIEYKDQVYTIDTNKPYEDYADVYIYYAKGKGVGD